MESERNKQWKSDQPRLQLGIFGILRESFRTIKSNGKLLFPLLVIVFLFFSNLEFAQTYLLEPVAKDLSLQLAEHPKFLEDPGNNMDQPEYRVVMNDIRKGLLVKLSISALCSVISLVFFVATVSSSYEAYTAKVLTFRELLLKIQRTWKKPTLTSFFVILIIMGFIFLCLFPIGIVSIFAKDSWAYLFYGVVLLVIPVICFYISALWMMSLVVSVLEDIGGLSAIVRARELMNGKKVQASLMMVLFSVAYGIVYSVTNAITSNNLENWSRLAISIPFANALGCALKLVMFVAFTVFYHEQKENSGKNEAKHPYVPIVASEV